MSGLVAAIVGNDDTGIRRSLSILMERATERGSDKRQLYFLSQKEMIPDPGTAKNRVTEQGAYRVIGCANSYPANRNRRERDFPVRSEGGSWVVAVDGIVTEALDNQWIANQIADSGFNVVEEFTGQFALVAFALHHPGKVFWTTRAKPLYGLMDGVRRAVFLASSKESFGGMYHIARSPTPFELPTYSRGTLTLDGQQNIVPLVVPVTKGTLMLSGGGLDSLVAAWLSQAEYPFEEMQLLNVDYGQRAAEREIEATHKIAAAIHDRFGTQVTTLHVHLNPFEDFHSSTLLPRGANVNLQPVKGHATEWVPARNTFLMGLALSFAEDQGLARIVTGINIEAAGAYPDNDVEWLTRYQALVPYATSSGQPITLSAPLGGMSKVDIVQAGQQARIPWARAMSWSCYQGKALQCGQCSSCRTRRIAFQVAKVPDPTMYADDGVIG